MLVQKDAWRVRRASALFDVNLLSPHYVTARIEGLTEPVMATLQVLEEDAEAVGDGRM